MLYVVRHTHPSEQCPARDPFMAAQLLAHLSPANAAKYGVRLHGEAVIKGQHTLILIAEAQDLEGLQRFMAPFHQAGEVEYLEASPCEEVVERGGC